VTQYKESITDEISVSECLLRTGGRYAITGVGNSGDNAFNLCSNIVNKAD